MKIASVRRLKRRSEKIKRLMQRQMAASEPSVVDSPEELRSKMYALKSRTNPNRGVETMERHKFYVKPDNETAKALRESLGTAVSGGLYGCYGFVYWDESRAGHSHGSLFIEFPSCSIAYRKLISSKESVDCNGHKLLKGDILSADWGDGTRHFGIYDHTENDSGGDDAKIFARWQLSSGEWERYPGFMCRLNVRFETRLPKDFKIG